MEISQLIFNQVQRPAERSASNRVEPQKKTNGSGLFKIEDKVELSVPNPKDRLAEIKKRVNSGYYNSGAVKEDITEKLTNVFDDLFR